MSKLSELVAVRVMGRKIDGNDLWQDSDGSLWEAGGIVAFRPDTSIADAWRLVEKMKHNCMVLYPHEHEDGAYVTARTDNWDDVRARESTMPLAICIAALRACGVPEREIEEARKQ